MLKMLGIVLVVLLIQTQYLAGGIVEVATLVPSPQAEVRLYDSLTFTCSGRSKALSVTWNLNKKHQTTLLPRSECPPFETEKPDIYEYTCSEWTFTLKIPNVTENRNDEQWMCELLIGSDYHKSETSIITVQVPVKTVQLKRNGVPVAEDSQLRLLDGNSENFTCTPGSSRPSPTIVWVLNGTKLKTSKEDRYTLTAAKDDHGKYFYCIAYNIQPEAEAAVSEKTLLYVLVPITSVELKENNIKVSNSSLVVTVGQNVSFTCKPGYGRPAAATIDWFIGTKERLKNSSVYTYDPKNADNGFMIYCQAYNIQERAKVNSTKPTLLVQVKVTSAEFSQNNSLITEETLTVTAETKFNLICLPVPRYSRPPPKILWYIQNGQSTMNICNGSEMSYIPTKENHNHKVYCRLYNLQSIQDAVMSASLRLYVRVESGIPTILSNTTDLLDGDSYTIQCKSPPTRPPANVTLQMNTRNIRLINTSKSTGDDGLDVVTSTVSYIASKYDNTGEIVCKSAILNQNDPREIRKTVTVWWQPANPVITPKPTFPWLEDQMGILTCTSNDTGNPPSYVSWLNRYGGIETQKQLTFSSLSYQHNGQLVKCQMDNQFTSIKGTTVETTGTLEVEYKPIVTVQCGNKTVDSFTIEEGQSKECHCLAKGNPQPVVNWLDASGGKLYLFQINRTQAGTYTCRANATSNAHHNYSFMAEQTLNVTVYYPPDVNISVAGTDVENRSLNLSCMPHGLPEQYKYQKWKQTWTGIPINSNAYLKPENAISIPALQLQDSGIYICAVENGIRDKDKNLYQYGSKEILVKVSPIFFLDESLFAGKLMENITVSIPFYAYPKYYSVSVMPSNSMENLNSSKYVKVIVETNITTTFYDINVVLNGYYCNFTIIGLEEDDFMDYHVLISNEVGSQQMSFTVKSERTEAPSFPLGAAVGGGIGAGCIIILAAVLIIVWKRKSATKTDDFKQSILSPKRHPASEKNDDTAEVNVNPVYESADEIPMPPKSDIYAQVDKQPKSSAQDSSADVYSQVQKPKVEISSKKEKKMKKQKDQKKNKNTKQTKLNEGLVYENSEILNGGKKSSEDLYENPACSNGDEKKQPKRTRNEDGLIYIDVELPKQTPPSKQKPVIHGEEDRTIYADIAYGQVGEQPPEKEGESQ